MSNVGCIEERDASLEYAGNRLLLHEAAGRYTSTFHVRDEVVSVANLAGKAVSYSYAAGQRSGMVDPDGGRFTYSQDDGQCSTTGPSS